MERFIANLVKDFESGKLNRRQFCETVALAATVYAAGEGAANAAPAQGFKVIAINHISYACPDYRKARDFYTTVLGMKNVKDDGKSRTNLTFGPGKGGNYWAVTCWYVANQVTYQTFVRVSPGELQMFAGRLRGNRHRLSRRGAEHLPRRRHELREHQRRGLGRCRLEVDPRGGEGAPQRGREGERRQSPLQCLEPTAVIALGYGGRRQQSLGGAQHQPQGE